MSNPYLGEIRMVGFGFAPKGWALCNGQTMLINQNQPLFALLGTTFGGNGVQNFLLPDFRGRAPLHAGKQPSGPVFTPGQSSGEELHTLSTAEMPSHTHNANASSAGNTLGSPSNNYWASGTPQYSTTAINTALAANAIAVNGSSQGHENRSPYQVINFIIALTGIFPTPN
jgi:microcystin-dependent protein